MATKVKYNTENLPVTLNSKEHMAKKNQYAKQVANELSVSLGVDFKQSSVIDLIQLIEAGKQLPPDNAPEYQKAYDRIETDMKRAMEILSEKEQEEARVKREEEEAQKAKEASELALVDSVGSLDVTNSFASISKKFDLGSDLNQCTLKEGQEVSDEEMMGYFVTALKMGEFSNWAKGDLIVQLEDRGHERAMQEYCNKTGTPYQTVYRLAVTARAVPPVKRIKGVSFTAYQEVATARLDKDEAKNTAKRDALIDRVSKGIGEIAGADFKNVVEVREAVREAAGKEKPAPRDPLAVDTEKDLFIVIDFNERNSYKTIGLKPGSLNDNDIEVIHAKTGRRCNDTKGTRWGVLEEWKDPTAAAPEAAAEPEPAQAAAPAKAAKKGKKK